MDEIKKCIENSNHYYKPDKDRLQKMVHNRYRGLSEEEKKENR